MSTSLESSAANNILIVDDNPDHLRQLSNLLETQGYLVHKSLGSKFALQEAHHHHPDLILLALNMPDLRGYEVCQQLKASQTIVHTPIIFISDLNCLADKIRAFELGGQDYITKPFKNLELLMRIKSHLLIQCQRQQLMQQNQRLKQEIQERLKAEAEVRQLSLTDDLTGLYNRRGFFVLAEQQLKIARRTLTPCCLLFADLDGLKQINDFWGHKTGDRLLMTAAQILKHSFREADIVARLGGDEFVVFICNCSEQTEQLQQRLQINIDQFNQSYHFSYQLSMSVGLQLCNIEQEYSLEYWLAQADKLMYAHKRKKYSA
ncbi:MAG: diguanylate cyclase [Elainella sp. Prado103]|jgi:diguanylate cyclase (GGDEF)-like protein|nr:diguanylate cyclase [Elainella sp. Prado103]